MHSDEVPRHVHVAAIDDAPAGNQGQRGHPSPSNPGGPRAAPPP